MHPDNRAVHTGRKTQPLIPVSTEFRSLSAVPPKTQQNKWQHQPYQQRIDKLQHAGLLAKQCGIIAQNLLVCFWLIPVAMVAERGSFTDLQDLFPLKKKYRKLPRNTNYSAYRHPRWWPTWMAIAFMWCVAQLPIRFQWWIGKLF